MKFFKRRHRLPKSIEKEIQVNEHDNDKVWKKLDQLEKGQERLSTRLVQVELRSGIFRPKPSGGKG